MTALVKDITFDKLEFLDKANNALGVNSIPWRVFFSPGRVNLIGEHLDYNGGHVLPCALDMGNHIAIRVRQDTKIRAFSENFPKYGVFETDIINEAEVSGTHWSNFLLGSLKVLKKRPTFGFDMFLLGNLPNGSGLSSSASVTCGMIYAMSEVFELGIERKEIALAAQAVENIHIGVNTGIMDQYSILFGVEDHATYIDTLNLTHELYPLILGDYALVISNTNKKRALQNSQYNDRRAACEAAEKLLERPIAGVDPVVVSKLPLPMNVLEKAIYVAEEEIRTKEAVLALSNNDLQRFAVLMNESHQGLRDKFKVTGEELDTLSDLMKKHGAIGSRMTGAGFGGCTVSLIPEKGLDEALKKVTEEYKNIIGYAPDHYRAIPSNGTKEVL